MPDRDSTVQGWERSILDTLEDGNQATIAELATALDAHPMTVERRCRVLQRNGDIRRVTAGTYALASDETQSTDTGAAD